MKPRFVRVTNAQTTVQGTGYLLGTLQYFVRLAGCAVRECPIRKQCDEQGSLSFMAGTLTSIESIAGAARETGWLHVTGGEPCDHPKELQALEAECRQRGVRIHLQTSGLRELPIDPDFVTVSPKADATKLLARDGDEIIIVYTGQDVGELRPYVDQLRFRRHYLVPLWDDQPNTEATIAALHRCVAAGLPYRLTAQAHKFWGIA